MAGVLGVFADLAVRLALGVTVVSEALEATRFRDAVARGFGVFARGVERGRGRGVRWKGCDVCWRVVGVGVCCISKWPSLLESESDESLSASVFGLGGTM